MTDATTPESRVQGGAAGPARWAMVLLPWSCLFLLPFGRTVEAPVLMMAVAGLVLIARRRHELFGLQSMRVFGLVFACMWLPMLLSLVDAVHPQRTALVVVNHLRFFLAGAFMCWALTDGWVRDRLLALTAWLFVAWLVDAGVQMALGMDVIGREVSGGHISGPFGAESRKFGTTLSVLAPLAWVFLLRRGSAWLLGATLLFSGYVVLSAGARAGWLSLAVCALGFGYVFRARLLSLPRRAVVVVLVLAAVAPVVAYNTLDNVAFRVRQSLGELTGQVPVEVSPLGHRGYIWKGAMSMIRAHPVNGVGARGFRYAFPDFAEPDDPFISATPPILPTHSHQLFIEIMAETGIIGIIGLLLAAATLIRAVSRAPAAVHADYTPYAIALAAAFFPFNTHLAIYSAHWSQMVWWLLAACCGCLAAARGRTPDAGRPAASVGSA